MISGWAIGLRFLLVSLRRRSFPVRRLERRERAKRMSRTGGAAFRTKIASATLALPPSFSICHSLSLFLSSARRTRAANKLSVHLHLSCPHRHGPVLLQTEWHTLLVDTEDSRLTTCLSPQFCRHVPIWQMTSRLRLSSTVFSIPSFPLLNK